MMERTNLAARLLAFSPSTEVTEALLPVAFVVNPVQLAASPGPALGTRQAKRNVHYAATLAAAATDPQLLARLAKMPQKTVRRLVAANPNTALETLESLRGWALNANTLDDDTLTALLSTLPPPLYLPHVRTRFRWEDLSAKQDQHWNRTGDVIADQLVRRSDAQMVWDTYRLDMASVNRSIVDRAVAGKLPVKAAALLHETHPGQLDSMLDAALSAYDFVLDDAVVDLVVARFTSADPIAQSYRNRAALGRRLSPYGVEQFVLSGSELLARSAAFSVASDKAEMTGALLDQLVATASGETVTVLLSRPKLRDRLSLEQLNSLALRMTSPNATAVREVLTCYGKQIEGAARVNMLRRADRTVTSDWIVGALNVAPTVAEMESLLAEPGLSLTLPRNLAYRQPEMAKMPRTIPELVDVFGDLFSIEVATRPEMAPVLDAAGTTTLRRALDTGAYDTSYANYEGHHSSGGTFEAPSGFAAYLAGRIQDRFGANPEAWLSVAKMAGDMLVGTVEEFLTLVAAMHGLYEAGDTADETTSRDAVDVVEAGDLVVVVDADALQPMLC